jgi:helix-loop-helix DNA-binding protein
MDPSRKELLPYIASCNPPRRVKRPSTTGTTFSGTDRPLPVFPSLALAPAISPLTTDVTGTADDDDLTPEVPEPKRRGRKPSTLSRAARESMRRQNHSRIEKARRTKINDALSTLRDLVPADAGRKLSAPADESLDEEDEEDEFGSGNTKKPGKSKQRQEKEFKLEILEKAVLYVQELQEKVSVLESRGCARCSNVNTSPVHKPKRKHEAMPPSDEYDSNSSVDVVMDRPMKRLTPTQSIFPPVPPAPNTRLPPISSWLLPSIPEQGLPESRTPLANPVQLPTPPSSAVIGPIASPQVPPSLRLELPVASMSAKNISASSQPSPSWTPEDESVASLLLRIKTSSSPKAGRHGASVSDLLAPTPGVPGIGGDTRFMGVDDMRVQTPGSLLGMTTDGPK